MCLFVCLSWSEEVSLRHGLALNLEQASALSCLTVLELQKPHLAFYMGPGNLNPGPYAHTVCAFPYRATSLALKQHFLTNFQKRESHYVLGSKGMDHTGTVLSFRRKPKDGRCEASFLDAATESPPHPGIAWIS